MSSDNDFERTRNVAAVVGAMAAVTSVVITIFALADSIPRKPYVNRDIDRKLYLDGIINDDSECYDLLRMSKESFRKLVVLFREKNLLRDSRNTKVEEQVAEFLHTIGHNVKTRVIKHNFLRSGETTNRYFHIVLKAVLSLYKDLVVEPTTDMETPPIIRCNEVRFWPWFKDCIGAIDGTHIRVKVPEGIHNRFRGKKEKPTQNVLAAVSFDLRFTYVLAGWEGPAHDTRVLEDALTRPNGLKVPEGKYYLVDAGYPNRMGFLAPFRGVRYHLKEWSEHEPENEKELFNVRHSSLRNSIERAFGILKKRWKILDDSESFFSFDTQVDVACCILHNYIIGVAPNDLFLSEPDPEPESGEPPKKKTKLTQKEQREQKKEWATFRLNMAHVIWDNNLVRKKSKGDTERATLEKLGVG